MVAHIFTLLLAPFTSISVNYWRHNETLNFREKLNSTTFSFENAHLTIFKHFSKINCASNNWSIWTQKVPKEACWCELLSSIKVFSKTFSCTVHERLADKNLFSKYVWSKILGSCFCEALYSDYMHKVTNRRKNYFWTKVLIQICCAYTYKNFVAFSRLIFFPQRCSSLKQWKVSKGFH